MIQVETDLAFYEYDNKVLCVTTKPGLFIDRPEMEQLLLDAIKITEGKKYAALIDTANQSDSTSDARNFYSNNKYNVLRYADAIVVSSLSVKLIANFFLKFNKPTVPTKLFNSKEEALQWLNSFIPEYK